MKKTFKTLVTLGICFLALSCSKENSSEAEYGNSEKIKKDTSPAIFSCALVDQAGTTDYVDITIAAHHYSDVVFGRRCVLLKYAVAGSTTYWCATPFSLLGNNTIRYEIIDPTVPGGSSCLDVYYESSNTMPGCTPLDQPGTTCSFEPSVVSNHCEVCY